MTQYKTVHYMHVSLGIYRRDLLKLLPFNKNIQKNIYAFNKMSVVYICYMYIICYYNLYIYIYKIKTNLINVGTFII